MPGPYDILDNADAECAVEALARIKSLGTLKTTTLYAREDGAQFTFESEKVLGREGHVSVDLKKNGDASTLVDHNGVVLGVSTPSHLKNEQFAIVEITNPTEPGKGDVNILYSSGHESGRVSDAMRKVRQNMLTCKAPTS